MIETLQLGSLTLVGERRGPYVAVKFNSDYGEQLSYVSASEWNSLLALADTKLAGEREVERLRAELKLERGGIDWKTLAINEEKERMNWQRIAEERHETLEQTRRDLGLALKEAVDACREVVRLANAIHDRVHEHEQRGQVDLTLRDATHQFLHYCVGASRDGETNGPRAVIGRLAAAEKDKP